MPDPLVSVVIPVFNGGNYLRQAIESALNQTYSKVEVLVVNDGSRDSGETERIALSFGDRVRYLYKENGGTASAVNLGVENMRGEYFSWLSHDDCLYPDRISRQLALLHEHGDPWAIVHGNFDCLDVDAGRTTGVDFHRYYPEDKLCDGNFAPVFLSIHGCGLLVHRSHFDRVGLFNPAYPSTQDQEFLIRAMRGGRSVFAKERLFMVRRHRDQGQNTQTHHGEELCRLFMAYCEAAPAAEKVGLAGNEENFYRSLYFRFHSVPDVQGWFLEYLRGKFSCFDDAAVARLREGFWTCLGGKVDAVYIFGAGAYGAAVQIQLRQIGIGVAGFVDNSPDRWHIPVNGAQCMGLDEFLAEKDAMPIIVALQDVDSVLRQLRDAGAVWIVPMAAVNGFFLNTSCRALCKEEHRDADSNEYARD